MNYIATEARESSSTESSLKPEKGWTISLAYKVQREYDLCMEQRRLYDEYLNKLIARNIQTNLDYRTDRRSSKLT